MSRTVAAQSQQIQISLALVLAPMQGPLGYLLRNARREGDGIDELIEKLKSLDFTAEADSGPPDEFSDGFSDHDSSDEEVPF